MAARYAWSPSRPGGRPATPAAPQAQHAERRPARGEPVRSRIAVPELPEVETVRSDSRAVTPATPPRQSPLPAGAPYAGTRRRCCPAWPGSVLVGVGRHGKYLLLDGKTARVLVAHLRMSGQLLAAAAGDPPAPHTHAVLAFSEGRRASFRRPPDLRRAVPGRAGTPGRAPGPEALPGRARASRPGRPDRRRRPLRRRWPGGGPAQVVLVDQRALAGIGNIYADEVCLRGRVAP